MILLVFIAAVSADYNAGRAYSECAAISTALEGE
jgi:hypothetical protein